MKRVLIATILAAWAAGCDNRVEPAKSVPEKRSDVHIQAPGVKIDVQKKSD